VDSQQIETSEFIILLAIKTTLNALTLREDFGSLLLFTWVIYEFLIINVAMVGTQKRRPWLFCMLFFEASREDTIQESLREQRSKDKLD